MDVVAERGHADRELRVLPGEHGRQFQAEADGEVNFYFSEKIFLKTFGDVKYSPYLCDVDRRTINENLTQNYEAKFGK